MNAVYHSAVLLVCNKDEECAITMETKQTKAPEEVNKNNAEDNKRPWLFIRSTVGVQQEEKYYCI